MPLFTSFYWLDYFFRAAKRVLHEKILMNFDAGYWLTPFVERNKNYRSSNSGNFRLRLKNTYIIILWQGRIDCCKTLDRRDLRQNKLSSRTKRGQTTKRTSNREQLCLIQRRFTNNSLESRGKQRFLIWREEIQFPSQSYFCPVDARVRENC